MWAAALPRCTIVTATPPLPHSLHHLAAPSLSLHLPAIPLVAPPRCTPFAVPLSLYLPHYTPSLYPSYCTPSLYPSHCTSPYPAHGIPLTVTPSLYPLTIPPSLYPPSLTRYLHPRWRPFSLLPQYSLNISLARVQASNQSFSIVEAYKNH
jgi:hypothetical protein